MERAASGGAAAARGCLIEGRRRLLLGELPLCGAAQSRDGGGCIYGAAAARGCSIEGRRGLLVWRTEKGLSVGAAAARGCLVDEGGRAVFQLRSMRTGISMATSSAADREPKCRVSVYCSSGWRGLRRNSKPVGKAHLDQMRADRIIVIT